MSPARPVPPHPAQVKAHAYARAQAIAANLFGSAEAVEVDLLAEMVAYGDSGAFLERVGGPREGGSGVGGFGGQTSWAVRASVCVCSGARKDDDRRETRRAGCVGGERAGR